MSRRKLSEKDYSIGNQISSKIILESPEGITRYGAGMFRWAELWQARNGTEPPAARGVEQAEVRKGQLNLFPREAAGQ